MQNRAPILGAAAGTLVLLGAAFLLHVPDAGETPTLQLPPVAPMQGGPLRAAAAGPEVMGETPKPFDQPDAALDFFVAQRLGAGARELPLEQLERVRREVEAREAALAAAPEAATASWSSLGPGNVGGRTRTIVIDPTDSDVIYAAGVAGGVWKSIDRGASWVATDDHMQNLAVCTLAMDPNDPQTLYAGTGEGYGISAFVQGLGIFKTTDGGASWTRLNSTANPAFHYVNKLVVSANDSQRIYAGTRWGVYRSVNGGLTWSVVLANPDYTGGPSSTNGCQLGCMDLAVRTDKSPDVLFASFGSFEADGLYRSDDGSASWVAYTTASYQGRMSIAIAPSDNDRIYLTMADNGGLNGFGRIVSIFRSDDGVSFSAVLDPNHKFSPWLMSYSSIATGCVTAPQIYSQGWYDNAIAVDPVDPDVVWVGGIDLFRSDDAGVTFGMSGYWFNYLLDPPPPTYLHADQHRIVFDPGYDGVTNQTMYVGNDGGLFRTENALAATTQEECPIASNPGPPPDVVWERLNNGYGVTQYYHGDVGRDGADLFVAGAQDNGTSRVLATDTPDSWKLIFGGDGGYVAIDPTNSQRMFIEIQFFPEIRRSLDGGQTFVKTVNGITDTDGQFITPFAMDPNDPDVLWTGGSRPWRTTNGADLWTLAGPNFAGPGRITAIAVAPSNSNVVYLGFDNGYVVKSTNALSPSPTWQIFTSGLFGGWVSSLSVHPVQPDLAWLTYSTYGINHVLRTTNGGLTWSPADGAGASGIPDMPVHWVTARPCDPSQLFAGTELGVFASTNGGATWQPSNVGLPHTVVETLTWRDDDTLVAYTFGRGAFLTELEPCCGAQNYCTGKLTSGGQPAAITYSGSPSFSSADLRLIGINGGVGTTLGIHIFSDAGPASIPFQNGTLCLASPVQRGPAHVYDVFGLVEVPIPIALDQIGKRRVYQFWFRDVAQADGTGVGLSDALDVTFCP